MKARGRSKELASEKIGWTGGFAVVGSLTPARASQFLLRERWNC